MPGGFDEGRRDETGWSLLYAPTTALQPVSCRACGKVFAAEASTCPWCGWTVARSRAAQRSARLSALAPVPTDRTTPPRDADTDADADADDAATTDAAEAVEAVEAVGGEAADGTTEPVPAGSTASMLAAAAPAPGLAPVAAARPPAARPPTVREQTRRWAGVLVAAGVLLAIATGVGVRSRHRQPATTAAVAVTTTATTGTTAPSPTTAGTTVAAAATGARPAGAPTVATTVGPAAPVAAAPTTAAPPATTAVPAPTTTDGPSFSEPERKAVLLTQELSDAVARHDWARVRVLAPRNAVSDDTYERYWGSIESASLVPVRVTASPDGNFDVYVGIVNVSAAAGGRTSSLVCGRYTVDPRSGTVTAVQSKPLRSTTGTLVLATVADELRRTCADPTF